jgi:hypothetical protein
LAKKYPSIKNDLIELGKQLTENPELGKPMGHNCYKIRLAITSKGKGKSGGARVITNLYVAEITLFMLTIYDKSEKEDISDKELKELLKIAELL